MRGELETSDKAAYELLDLCKDLNPETNTLACRAIGANLFYQGQFYQSRFYCRKGFIKYTDKEKALRNAQIDVNEPALSCLGYIALNSWFIGDLINSNRKSNQMLTKSITLDHKHTIIIATYIKTLISQYSLKKDETHILSQKLIVLSAEFDIELWNIAGEILKCWSIDDEDILSSMEYAIERWEMTGAKLFTHYWFGLLAEKFLQYRYYEKALINAKKGIELSNTTNDRHWVSELFRIKSICLFNQGINEMSQVMINYSINIAKEQKSKSLLLRSLCTKYDFADKEKKVISEEIKLLLLKFKYVETTYDIIKAKTILNEIQHS